MPSIYQPRRPRASPLWQLLTAAWDAFLASYEKKHRPTLGPLRPNVFTAVRNFLRCGDLASGFLRFHCSDCGHERLLAFTCKGRHLCPACHQRRVRQTADWIASAVCHEVPHRQFVFTIPKILRGIFRKRRDLLHLLFKTATETLQETFRTRLNLPDGKLGAIAAVHTFGDYLIFHPHLHVLAADGLFTPDGRFHCMPAEDLAPAIELFRHRFLHALRDAKLISPKTIQDPRQKVKYFLPIGFTRVEGSMSSKRWLSPWKDSLEKPAIYHCISRVVDRRFVFENAEREHFRMFMRMQENFSGCRVLSYCIMSNHFHLLLEVPPMPVGGISEEVLLKRLSATNSEAFVAVVAKELAEARAEERDEWVAEIYGRFTYRMHDLSEFMKTLLQRFTRWFNREHQRSGTLWEERYKSVIVESGTAARTMAAYIDLNPVRAGMVEDPAEYRWSSYGEAVGGGKKGNGKKAREGLVRAYFCDQGVGFDSARWPEVSRLYRRLMGLALERKSGKAELGSQRRPQAAATAMEALEAKVNGTVLPDLNLAAMLRCRVRYFTDGAVIGSRAFVNEAFAAARERFTAKRKDGARRMKGNGKAAAGVLWSVRDLRVRV